MITIPNTFALSALLCTFALYHSAPWLALPFGFALTISNPLSVIKLAADPLTLLVHCCYMVDLPTLIMERHDGSVPRKVTPSRRIARCARP